MASERLDNIMVIDILPERKVVFLEHSVTVQDTLEILNDKKLSSAPVVNLVEGKFLGIVDMFDIVTFILGIFPDNTSVSEQGLHDLEYAGKHFAETPIGQVVEMAAKYDGWEGGPHPVRRETMLTKVAELFWLGLHRVPVVNTQNNIINIITQSDLLGFMAQNIHLIGNKAKLTLAELNLDQLGPPQVVEATTPTSSVLLNLLSKRISAVPVVDNEGKLLANFSVSDLKGLTRKNLSGLSQPVYKFLEKRAAPDEAFACERSLHPLTVTSTDSLASVIFKMVATRVHRLWSIDSQGKPIGVVAITDLMTAFTKN